MGCVFRMWHDAFYFEAHLAMNLFAQFPPQIALSRE